MQDMMSMVEPQQWRYPTTLERVMATMTSTVMQMVRLHRRRKVTTATQVKESKIFLLNSPPMIVSVSQDPYMKCWLKVYGDLASLSTVFTLVKAGMCSVGDTRGRQVSRNLEAVTFGAGELQFRLSENLKLFLYWVPEDEKRKLLSVREKSFSLDMSFQEVKFVFSSIYVL